MEFIRKAQAIFRLKELVQVLTMRSKFTLAKGNVAEKLNIDKYLKTLSCDEFFVSDELYSKSETESWESFVNRVDRISEQFVSFALAEFLEKDFKIQSMPQEYNDFQYAAHSEFEIHSFGFCSSFDLSTWFSKREMDNHREYKKARCCNISRIKELFSIKQLFTNYLYDLETDINQKSARNALSVRVWLAHTSGGDKRRIIENYLHTGDLVTLTLYKKGEYVTTRDIYPVSDNSHFKITTTSGDTIGDISLGYDLGPSDEDNKDCREYCDIYRPLLNDGTVVVTNGIVTQIVPHGTPRGRKIKALVELEISFQQISPINRTNNHLFPPGTDIKHIIEKNATMMRQLAAIDYNRKCDIINGVIPDRYNLKQLLPKENANLDEYQLLVQSTISNFSLSNVDLDYFDLKCFWNVYMPLICTIDRDDDSIEACNYPRYANSGNMLLMLERIADPFYFVSRKPKTVFQLTLFRKKLCQS